MRFTNVDTPSKIHRKPEGDLLSHERQTTVVRSTARHTAATKCSPMTTNEKGKYRCRSRIYLICAATCAVGCVATAAQNSPPNPTMECVGERFVCQAFASSMEWSNNLDDVIQMLTSVDYGVIVQQLGWRLTDARQTACQHVNTPRLQSVIAGPVDPTEWIAISI